MAMASNQRPMPSMMVSLIPLVSLSTSLLVLAAGEAVPVKASSNRREVSSVAVSEAIASATEAAAVANSWDRPEDATHMIVMTSLSGQFFDLWSAGWKVAGALYTLSKEVVSEIMRYIVANRWVLFTIVLGVLVYAAIVGFRRQVNRSWEQDFKGAGTTRRVSQAGADLMALLGEDDAQPETEDELTPATPRAEGGPVLGRVTSRMTAPTVAERFCSATRTSGTLSAKSSLSLMAMSESAGSFSELGKKKGRPLPGFLRQIRIFADFDEECLEFLLSHQQVTAVAPGDAVFKKGDRRDAFLVVQSGEVLVEACPWRQQGQGTDFRKGDEYALHAGDTVVGLCFVLANLPADASGATSGQPPQATQLHGSSARAGEFGAEVVAIPTTAFAEAFERFPEAMLAMVRRLCVRISLVVFETLSTYFGLKQEIMIPTDFASLPLTAEELAKLSPKEVFSLFLGETWKEGGHVSAINSVLETAEIKEFEDGQYVLPPEQRASHMLLLLEGDLHMYRDDHHHGREQARRQQSKGRASTWREFEDGTAEYRVNIGEAIGELDLLVDRPAPVLYLCHSKCRFAALPRASVHKLFEFCPRAMCIRLLHLLAARTATWLHRVDAALDWLPVEGGQCLFRKGGHQVGFFVVLSGRLVVLEEKSASNEGKLNLSPRAQRTTTAAAMAAGGHASSSAATKAAATAAAAAAAAGKVDRGQWQVSDVLQRGRLCGEIDCLRETPYSHTVRASRDSEVCRVSSVVLHLLAMDFPKAILHFSSLVGPRSSGEHNADLVSRRTTIAVVPAKGDVDVHAVCVHLTAALNKLGKTLHISSTTQIAGDMLGRPGKLSGLGKARLGRFLAELEERCRWLIYEAEPPVRGKATDWTRRCIRQADHVLVAVNFDGSSRGDVPESPNEKYIQEAGLLHVDRELLILHPFQKEKQTTKDDWFALTAKRDDGMGPGLHGFVGHHMQLFLGNRRGRALRSTRHYLNTRPWARRWHHVRLGEAKDWARCARLLAGRGIGLCLGGGGARGNCHFGVVKAFEELGIPVDVVSGTSFGALAGAIYSMTAPEPGSMIKVVRETMGKRFTTRGMLMDLNFPRTAYFTGYYLNSVLKDAFARRRIEDLLVPFACPSCDIVSFGEKMHREGPLWRIVRASMSLVGFVPPMPFKERRPEDGVITNSLLVDGGYVNQYPIEVLKEHGAGIVVTVVVCPDYEPVSTDYGDFVKGGLVTLRRTFGCCRRRNVIDPPTQAEIQERLMFLVESMKESHSSRSDLTIYPDITPYSLLDFAKYDEIMQAGYKAGRASLEKWLAEDSPTVETLKQIIQGTVELAEEKPSVNEVEYGSRTQYAKWRAARHRASEFMRTASQSTQRRASAARRRAQEIVGEGRKRLLLRRRSNSVDTIASSNGEVSAAEGATASDGDVGAARVGGIAAVAAAAKASAARRASGSFSDAESLSAAEEKLERAVSGESLGSMASAESCT